MDNIRIATAEELIKFVEESDLNVKQYSEVIKAFYNQTFVMFSETTKGDLLEFLEVCKQHRSKGWELPLFIEQRGKHFKITDLYHGSD